MALPNQLRDREYKKFYEDDDGNVAVRTSGEGGGGGAGASTTTTPTHFSPQDFSTFAASGTAIHISGASFDVDDSNATAVYVLAKEESGVVTQFTNGASSIYMNLNSGVLHVSGATTYAFKSGDVYTVGIQYQEKSFTSASDSERSEEIDPVSQHFAADVVVNSTGGMSGVNTYYLDMAGYKRCDIQNIISGILTVSGAISLQDDGTAASSCTYDDTISGVWYVGSESVVSVSGTSGATKTQTWQMKDEIAAKYIRLNVYAMSGAGVLSSDATIYAKRTY